MVRFIINHEDGNIDYDSIFTFQYGQIYYFPETEAVNSSGPIYIPIWLDLLCICDKRRRLHSWIYIPIWLDLLFIIKNGIEYDSLGIYIPIWLDLLFMLKQKLITKCEDLHSNMVRFIIYYITDILESIFSFTFQYGQIYYASMDSQNPKRLNIYIPIWLDLLSAKCIEAEYMR